MSQAQKRVWKRDNEVQTLRNVWDIWHGCQQICRWTMVVLLHMHSGFPTEILEQTIVTSLIWCHEVLLCNRGGNYKRECNRALGLLVLSSGCFNTSVWVFSKPQTSTLAVSVPSSRKHNWNAQCCLFFHKHASRLIWRLWVIVVHLSDGDQADHYLLPLNLVSCKAITPLW